MSAADRGVNAILISPEDNVVTVTRELNNGETVRFLRNGETVELISSGAPKYHKLAITDIPSGGDILKYGEVMACASSDIRAGEHVHCHNVTSGVK